VIVRFLTGFEVGRESGVDHVPPRVRYPLQIQPRAGAFEPDHYAAPRLALPVVRRLSWRRCRSSSPSYTTSLTIG
jgi:hypothetical protein